MLAAEVPANTKKLVPDVWNAYHSVPIRSEDKNKLPFITPCGCFTNGFTHRNFITSLEIKNTVTLVDDILVWENTLEDNFKMVCRLLEFYSKA